jgi:hypothetical protein
MDFKNSGVTSTTFSIENGSNTSPAFVKEYISLPTFCLMIDILGAGRIMCSTNIPIESFAKETESLFKECFNNFNVAGDYENDPRFGASKSMRLSDTFVMWAHSCESETKRASIPSLEEKALEYLIMAGHHLMIRGFESNFALRGSISFGECIQDISSNAIIGAPWVYANKLEKCQEWAGVTLHHTASRKLTEKMKAGQLVSQYEVPGKQEITDNWVIDWREWVTRENICKTFDSIPSDKTNEGGAKKP